MADWTPIRPARCGLDSVSPVRIAVHGALEQCLMFLSADVMERLGNPTHAVPMLNGDPDVLGIRGTDRPVRGETLRLLRANDSKRLRGPSAARMSMKGTLDAMGKAIQALENVPHRWDGDVLVVDLSGLPDAPGRP